MVSGKQRVAAHAFRALLAAATGGRSGSGSRVAAHKMEPKILCSSFLSSGDANTGSAEKQLAVVLLNWTLPALTPQLWHKGAGWAAGPAGRFISAPPFSALLLLLLDAMLSTCAARAPNP